jgi:hypothetical protein
MASPPLADFLRESVIDSGPLPLLKPEKRRRHDFQKPSGSRSRLPILLNTAQRCRYSSALCARGALSYVLPLSLTRRLRHQMQ